MDPDDLGVYLIHACGYTTPSCATPGVGLGGLTLSQDNSILGGLPLTVDDFRTHNAPLPKPHTGGSFTRSRTVLPEIFDDPYALTPLDALENSTIGRHCTLAP